MSFIDAEAMQRAREASRPCVDCGLLTGCFCDFCYIAERYPCPEQDRLRHTPLCTRCDRENDDGCHYCRRVQWCTPPTWEKTGTYRPDTQPTAQKNSSPPEDADSSPPPQGPPFGADTSVPSAGALESTSPPVGRCIVCNHRGPTGHLCTRPSCEDSGAIYDTCSDVNASTEEEGTVQDSGEETEEELSPPAFQQEVANLQQAQDTPGGGKEPPHDCGTAGGGDTATAQMEPKTGAFEASKKPDSPSLSAQQISKDGNAAGY